MKRIFSIVFLLLVLMQVKAQRLTRGDSSVVSVIEAKLKQRAAQKTRQYSYLTKQQFQKAPGFGSQITADVYEDTIRRIVIQTVLAAGPFSEEYYYEGKELIFVYQTQSYFREIPTPTTFINFKGERAWESRIYFMDGNPVYEQQNGTRDSGLKYTASDFNKEKAALFQFVTNRLSAENR
jgi:hypothetical protein